MSQHFIPVFSGGTGRSGTTVIANCLHRHPEFHTSMPREIRYLTDRAGLLDLNFGRPLAFEASAREYLNRIFLKTYFLLGKNEKRVFKERMHKHWWSQVGKSGNPRGLVQAITPDELDQALNKLLNSKVKRNGCEWQELALAGNGNGKSTYRSKNTSCNKTGTG